MGNGHHLIHGEMRDFVTGEILPDTDDERFRQKLARLLVEKKGYKKENLRVRVRHDISTVDPCGHVVTDLVIRLGGRAAAILRYGPGSLVTRQRPALAAARTIEPSYTVPVAIVTNGRDAEILETRSGLILGRGLDAIPSRNELRDRIASVDRSPVSPEQREAEKRILMAFEGIEHACERSCRSR